MMYLIPYSCIMFMLFAEPYMHFHIHIIPLCFNISFSVSCFFQSLCLQICLFLSVSLFSGSVCVCVTLSLCDVKYSGLCQRLVYLIAVLYVQTDEITDEVAVQHYVRLIYSVQQSVSCACVRVRM